MSTICSIPNKWAKLMGSSAFEPLFFGSGGSMFSMARVGPIQTAVARSADALGMARAAFCGGQ
jgi:hypothetical protein